MTTETNQNPTGTPAAWAGAELRMTDPRSLTLDRNARTLSDLEQQHPELVASVATHGVLQPILADEDPEGIIHVRDGHCRTIAAVLARLPDVPVIVTDAHADEHDSARLVDQYSANQIRQALDAGDQSRILEELTLFGLSAEEIAASLATTTETVESGLAVRRSAPAKETLAEHPELDLTTVAYFAEFESDEEAMEALQATLDQQPEQLAHEASRLRHEKARRQAIAAKAAELRAGGVTVYETWREAAAAGASPLYGLYDRSDEGERTNIDDTAHAANCPGHAVMLRTGWDSEVQATAYCTDPVTNGHESLWHTSSATQVGGTKSDTEKAEMRRVRQNNADYRAATDVRREFVATLCQRSNPPKAAHRFLAEVLIAGDHEVTNVLDRHHHDLARQFVSSDYTPGKTDPLAGGLPRASANTSIQRCLAVLLGAYEQAAADVHTWRDPSRGMKRYFDWLTTTWGYHPSLVEKLVNSPDADAEQWDHLASDQAGDETVLGRDEQPPGGEVTMPVECDEALETVASAGWSVTTVHLPGDEPDAPAVPGEDPVTHLDEDDAEELDDGWFANEANTEAAEDGGQAAGSEVV